jgi:serine/threonine-protein kinase
MSAAQWWKQVKAIFDAAVERSGEDRAALVRARCGDDRALQADVESLLAADRARGSLLEQPLSPSLRAFALGAVEGKHGLRAHSLVPGTQLDTYRIAGILGTGGMGEVYRAHDVTLGREVAIKVLPDHRVSDPEYRARLELEARLLAALNHPNIGAIYGMAENDDVRGLVLELVEGDTLAERIAREKGRLQRMRLRDVLSIALQIAEALEAAHERGIVHRDLKPSNIKISPDGRVKVLDFGVASFAGDSAGSVLAQQDTETRESAPFGTASYMSPEQARGERVDRRSDIWAFGCIVYEMLTGERAFDGSNVPETISRVLYQDPDSSKVPPDTPSTVTRLISLCLEKDRTKRLTQVAIARFEIADAIANPLKQRESTSEPRHVRRMVTTLAVGVLLGVVVGLTFAAFRMEGKDSATAPLTRLLVGVAPAEQVGGTEGRPTRTAFAISPDGSVLVFSAVRGNQRALYMRRLDQSDAVPIQGTDGAEGPFFSPDGQWVGYWVGATIHKASLSGGPPVPVTEIAQAQGLGASWGDDDRIVFSGGAGLLEIPASGGTVTALTILDETQGELSHRLPHALPGGEAVLFTIVKNRFPRWDESQIAVYSRRTGRSRILVNGGADARYASSGHLVYVREGLLLAAPFDLQKLELTGGPVGLAADVMQAAYFRGQRADSGAGQFALSTTGTLVYLQGGTAPPADRSIVRVNRSGRSETLPLPPRPFATLRLSPNGEEIALSTFGRERGVWLYALKRDTLSRLSAPGRNGVPIWTPDGERITYAAGTSGPDRLQSMRADSAGSPEALVAAQHDLVPATWTPDARQLLYYPIPPSAIRVFDLTTKSSPRMLPAAAGTASLGGADVSPDGRWIAYHSNESGESQVYVQAYPAGVPRYRISGDGGISPVWRRNGREIFYLRQNAPPAGRGSGDVSVMAVPVAMTPAFRFRVPRELFTGPYATNQPARAYDVTPDGQSFLLIQSQEAATARITHISVVQNWLEELKQRVPTR